jgi:type IVB pilus formation R64 PilN family outer membrane protein
MEFGIAVRTLFEGLPVSMGFDHDVDQSVRISVYHDGTIRSWLDNLALASGYAYKINDNHISWHRMMTASFDIMAISGSRNHLVGSSSGGGSSGQQGAGGSGGAITKEFSNNKGTLSVWQDLKEILTSLVSEEGTFFVSEANTSITVKDFPENVRSIASVIDEFNQRLSAQVVLDVQILSVTLEEDRADGIDWNLVKTNTDTTLDFSHGLNESDDVETTSGIPTKFSVIIPDGSRSYFTGSDVLIEALELQGDVSVVTSPRAVTLNNEVAEIRINLNTTYLASSSTTISDDIVETELTPDVAIDGFTMYLLPKIDVPNREVYLQLSTTVAELQKLSKIEAGRSLIQVPKIQDSKVNTRARLKSGETLLISGYQQYFASSEKSGQFGIDLFGRKHSRSKKHEMMVLLTPIIVDD